MGGRPQRQDVEDHGLVVAAPLPEAAEPRHRLPSHEDRRVQVPHEVPVGALIDGVRQRADPGLDAVGAGEVLPGVQDAGEQQRRVDRGQLRVPRAQPGGHVEEVVIEALVADESRRVRPLRIVPERLERGAHAGAALVARDPAVIDADADRRQTESHRGDAARRAGRVAVLDQAVRGIGLVPEVLERGVLHAVQQRLGRDLGARLTRDQQAAQCDADALHVIPSPRAGRGPHCATSRRRRVPARLHRPRFGLPPMQLLSIDHDCTPAVRPLTSATQNFSPSEKRWVLPSLPSSAQA